MVPATLTKRLAAQVLQGRQLVAFAVVLKVPLAQGAQTRSVTAEPGTRMRWPAAHAVWTTHAVAGFAS